MPDTETHVICYPAVGAPIPASSPEGRISLFPEDIEWVKNTRHNVARELGEVIARRGGHDTHPSITLSQKLIARSRDTPGSDTYRLHAIFATEDAVAEWHGNEQIAKSLSAKEKHDLLMALSEMYAAAAVYVDLERRKPILQRAIEVLAEADWLLPKGKSAESLVADTLKLSVLWERIYDTHKEREYLDTAIQILESPYHTLWGEDLQTIEAHIRTVRLKRGDNVRIALDLPFKHLSLESISLDDLPAGRYRFIDARSLADGGCLRVLDFDALPRERYVAVSYVWRGPPPPKGMEIGPTMTIRGASNADPISIDTLRIACLATLRLNCALLWIDGFCIKQGDDADKAWQIQRMYSIYQHCHTCLVLPGGLSRLVRPDEGTSWVHRAWTLQEALAPKRCEVLFSWTRGSCFLQTVAPAFVEEVLPGQAAMANMRSLLDISMRREYYIVSPDGKWGTEKYPIRLLVNGDSDSVHLHSLIGALDLRGTDGAPSAIWRAAIMRTAYRPVDMVFSIMGLLGVDLDPTCFTANDRTPALVELMRKLLAKGERAEWLAIVPPISPGGDLTTLPIIPKPSVSGPGLVIDDQDREFDAAVAAAGIMWWLKDAPRGSIDDQGFLNLVAPAASVAPISTSSESSTEAPLHQIRDYQGQRWTITPERRDSPPYAVKIGKKENYLGGAYPTWIDCESVMLMLVNRGDHEALRVLGYAAVGEDVPNLPGWSDITLRLK